MPFSHLFTTIQCGPFRLKNRIVMAPVITGLERHANINALMHFYEQRAKAGVSMITVPEAIVHPTGKRFQYERVFDEHLDIPRHKLLVNAIHQHDCLAVMQLTHRGRMADVKIKLSSKTTATSWRAPSFVLKHLIRRYAIVAERVMRCNYDGVEIDASEQSLIADFLSPITNRRGDEWGRSQLARFKLALDVVRAVRREIGENKLIGFRFNLMELSPHGADWAETKRLIQMLRMAGVNYLCAEFGNTQQTIPTIGANTVPGAWNAAYERLASATDLPVMFGQDVGALETMETLAKTNDNAIFELSRPLLADVDFVQKIQSNCTDTIKPCLRCLQGCQKLNSLEDAPIFCPVNPFLFTPNDQQIVRAEQRKKILVVGAGIAGISFSIMAAKRGHKVDLYEAEPSIGGQLRMMAKIPGKRRILGWLEYLSNELAMQGVSVQTGVSVRLDEELRTADYDAIVIATGSRPKMASIEGIGSSNVVTFDEVLAGEEPVGHRIALIGANAMSLDVAKYLTDGLNAEELTPQAWLDAWGIGDPTTHKGGVLGVIPSIAPPKRQIYLFEAKNNEIKELMKTRSLLSDWQWVLMKGAHTFENVNFENIDNYSIRVSFGEQHKDSTPIRIDHVVLCMGQIPDRSLSYALQADGFRTSLLGACSSDEGYQTIETIMRAAFKLAQEM